MEKKIAAGMMLTLLLIGMLTSALNIQLGKTESPVKIGVIGPLDWIQAVGIKEGAIIAAEEINVAGGILGRPTELFFGNTQGNPTVAVAEMVNLFAQGVDFVVGGFNTECIIAMHEIAMDHHKIFIITGAANNELVDCDTGTCGSCVRCDYDRYKYVFRVTPPNETTLATSLAPFLQGYVIPQRLLPFYGEYLWPGAPTKQVKVAVIAEDLQWTDTIYNYLMNPTIYPIFLGPYANVTYGARVDPNTNAAGFIPYLTAINASEARLIVHLFSAPAGTNFIWQWGNMGVEAIPVGMNVLSELGEQWEWTAGKCEYEAFLASSGTRTPITDLSTTFWDAYVSKWGHDPIYPAFGSYEAIYTLKEAIEIAGTTDSDAVVAELEQIDRDSTLGRFKFTEYHDVFCNESGTTWTAGYTRPLVVQWQAGRKEVIWPTDQQYSKDFELPPCMHAEFSDPSPGYSETSEYLIGSAAIGIIFLESDGGAENWDSDREQDVVLRIDDGLDVLASYNPFSFTFDVNYRVSTSYEPINGPHTDDYLWVSEAMANLGYAEGDHLTRVRNYINNLRNSKGTDWAFAIFVVDSENDPDGCFTDWYPEGNCYWYAFAYIGGPYFVMTYDVGGDYQLPRTPGIAQMDRVTAHETCHIFWATDEYDGQTENSGYLNVYDVEGSGDLMDNMNWGLSEGTKGQIGWRPFGGIEDPINTFPDTYLVPYSPDPATDPTPTYTGSVVDVPYRNSNPKSWNSHRDVTINTITNVQFRVDSGSWMDATPVEGTFDDALEDFTFTTPPLTEGTHKIETRGINSVGNTEVSYASDTVTVDLNNPPAAPTVDVTPDFPYTADDLTATVTSSSTDPDGDTVTYTYEWYKNEVLQPAETTVTTELSDTVLSIVTAKGEVWKCVVTPNDGTVNGTSGDDQVIIQNTAPVAYDLKITPYTPYTTDDLVATYSYMDADGDTESGSEIRWHKDGILQQDYSNQLVVPALATVEGEIWHFTVRPKDGTDFGYLAPSNNVTIIISVETIIQIGDKNYTTTTESNATITDVTATRNTLHFTSYGPTGETAYINTTFPVGLNKTEIKVFIDEAKLTPPPFPIITTNGTHYFIYFEYTLSTHNITIQFAPALLGDINDDGTVNILDAIKLAGAFGSEPGQPRWNSAADINNDDAVNILDAIILAGHFGETV